MANRGGRVLVVEDDDSMRAAIESLLKAAGYATSAYASAEELIAAGRPEDARCIVSDIRLPAMSGLELIAELRERGDPLPVILITVHESPASRSEAGRRGAAAFLSRPVARGDLLAAIENAVH